MIIVVDATSGASVTEADQLSAFSVRAATADAAAVAAALGDAGRTSDREGHVWVSADWVRASVDGDASWQQGFDDMVAYAGTKGWLDPDGTHILAHIEVG